MILFCTKLVQNSLYNSVLCKKYLMITIYHNATCSKSLGCLQNLESEGLELNIVRYLDFPLTKTEIESLLKKLGIKPIELVRQKEEIWINNFGGKTLTDGKIIDVLVQHPELIERPIVVNGDKAVIARPFERIHEIL
jgi:arsenate reductase (glutaredoxin)